jgi:NDP-sugar pyrophosphorylase family protein
MKAADFFTLPRSLAPFLTSFQPDAPPWEWLKQIGPALAARRLDQPFRPLPPEMHVEGWVYLHPSVKLPATATLVGPAWIGAHTEIRAGAYIRGNVIVGENCVLGNSCEFKNCLLMDGVQAPHFNYVGDSVLGNGAHLGAGAILSNFRLDQKPIVLRLPGATVETGLRKFGAILGDRAEIGCNAVLQPGTLLGPRALVMPAMAFGGWLPPKTIAKTRQVITTIERRD